MKFQALLFLGQLLLLCNVYDYAYSKALVGPNVRNADEFMFPYVVFVTVAPNRYFDPNYPFYCTGALVTRRDVLCSDHCLRNKVPADVQVNGGDYDLRRTTIWDVEWWVTYETWAMSRQQRVTNPGQSLLTIIRLAENVTDVVTARISYAPRESLFGEQVQIVGWGKVRTGRVPMKVQVGDVAFLTTEECQARYEAMSGGPARIPDMVICSAGDPHVVSVSGDFGAPVILNNRLVGVTRGPAPRVATGYDPNQVNIHFHPGYFQTFIEDVIYNCH